MSSNPRLVKAAEDQDSEVLASGLEPSIGRMIGCLLLTTFTLCIAYFSYVMLSDYFDNMNRRWYELAVGIPILSVTAFFVATIAQVFSAALLVYLSRLLFRRNGRVHLPLLLLATPALGILAWFGYEYLIPDYRWYSDDSPAYIYGPTLERFLKAWIFEVAVVIGYWWLLRKPRVADRSSA